MPAGKFKFNTGEPVTAETFQHALERDLNPKQASYFGAVFLAPFIKGASDFKGKPGEHVSGHHGERRPADDPADPAGRVDGPEAVDPVRLRDPERHARRPEGRPHDRRRGAVLHLRLHAEPVASC